MLQIKSESERAYLMLNHLKEIQQRRYQTVTREQAKNILDAFALFSTPNDA